MRFAFLHQRRIGRQFSQPFTRGSFEGKTIHTEVRYLCDISGLEIWAPQPSDECSFHFLTGYAYTTQCSTKVCLETGSSLAEVSQRVIQADLPNGKKALLSRVNGSVQNPVLSQLHYFFTQLDS